MHALHSSAARSHLHSGAPHTTHPHSRHHTHHANNFLKRFVICLLLTVPVLVLSHTVQQIFGFHLIFLGDQYLLTLLSTGIFLYGGMPFLRGLQSEIQQRNIGMMTLIGVAITTAWLYSIAVTFGLPGMDFYWEMATLIDIMLIGHYVEMKSIAGASHALEMLVRMLPSLAHRVVGDHLEEVQLDALNTNDIILVKPGEKIPADGKVIDGISYLDESMLTGESTPIKKAAGSSVIAGAVNGNGSLTVKISAIGNDTYLHRVIHMVEEAQTAKSKTQNFADRAAKVLTYVALIGGGITLCVWLTLGSSFAFALERMVTVMVISCPHALGLAVPLVAAISTSVSAAHGLLIRNRTAFENARRITTMVFDKTGTVTTGKFALQHVQVVDSSYTEETILGMAAAVERYSEHYIAKGIVHAAETRGVPIPTCTDFHALPGQGVSAMLDGHNVKLVGINYLLEHSISVPTLEAQGSTVVYVLIDKHMIGYVLFSDEIRQKSFEAVALLRSAGIKTMLLTGDNEHVAESVCTALHMDGFFANVLPHEKLERIRTLQQGGAFVAMAGDGVNDAPALAGADIGIAVGSGTDVAAETADIILVHSNPKDIAKLILFGRATYTKMIQNLWWAAGYNIIAIPLAGGVLYPWGIMLSPAVGAVLMSLSTIVVAYNAQRLRRILR